MHTVGVKLPFEINVCDPVAGTVTTLAVLFAEMVFVQYCGAVPLVRSVIVTVVVPVAVKPVTENVPEPLANGIDAV